MKKIHPRSDPIKVPHLVLDVLADGTPSAAADGAPLDPPPSAGPWRRAAHGQIDSASRGRPSAARAEGLGSDSTTFADVIATVSRRRAPEPATAAEEAIGTADPPAFAKIEETGFLPGEDVAVAIVLGHAEAGPTGMARAIVDSARRGAAEIVLIGRTSGTLTIRPLP